MTQRTCPSLPGEHDWREWYTDNDKERRKIYKCVLCGQNAYLRDIHHLNGRCRPKQTFWDAPVIPLQICLN